MQASDQVIEDDEAQDKSGDVAGMQGAGDWTENQEKQGMEGGDFDYGSQQQQLIDSIQNQNDLAYL